MRRHARWTDAESLSREHHPAGRDFVLKPERIPPRPPDIASHLPGGSWEAYWRLQRNERVAMFALGFFVASVFVAFAFWTAR